MKILSIIGARPQFIKAVVVSLSIRQVYHEILLHTGQHYDPNLSEIFFNELGIPQPDIHLNIGSGSHAEQTGRMLIEIEKAIMNYSPDWVLVYGDTNSTIAGALAAAKLHVPIAHVEAGLRSFNREMPEEINRVVCDHLSDILFCPTEAAVNNLQREGITKNVFLVGDVMADTFQLFGKAAKEKSEILSKLNLQPKKYALATIHRQANTDNVERLKSILTAFAQSDMPIVFPIHPRTSKMLAAFSLNLPPTVISIDPIGYLDMLQLELNADCILTDSGGIQKEAYWAGVRCITLREETEWVETVELGWNTLVGADSAKIVHAIKTFHPTCERIPVYGDGHTADKITNLLSQFR